MKRLLHVYGTKDGELLLRAASMNLWIAIGDEIVTEPIIHRNRTFPDRKWTNCFVTGDKTLYVYEGNTFHPDLDTRLAAIPLTQIPMGEMVECNVDIDAKENVFLAVTFKGKKQVYDIIRIEKTKE